MSDEEQWSIGEYLKSLQRLRGPEGVYKALDLALAERQREIDLYWTRTGYFWALVAVAFAGYFGLAGSDNFTGDAEYTIACIGTVVSYSWYCVNRGSKYWQLNWEYQVEMLEDSVLGPVHRNTLDHASFSRLSLFSPYPYSVSRINQILSLFITCVWLVLAGFSGVAVWFGTEGNSPAPAVIGPLALVALATITWAGRAGRLTHRPRHRFTERPPNRP